MTHITAKTPKRTYNRPAIEYSDGYVFTTRSGFLCTVLKLLDDGNYLIQFNESGQVQTSSFWSIYKRTVIDHFVERKYGVGFAKGTLENPLDCQNHLYIRWSSLLHRCYSGKVCGYENVAVCDEWHNFDKFKNWFETEVSPLQYNDVALSTLCIDKDLFCDGNNRIYSPDTCCIIPQKLNCVIKHLTWLNGKIIGLTQRKRDSIKALMIKYDASLTSRVKRRLTTILSNSSNHPEKQLSAIIWHNGNKYSAKTIDELKEIIKIIDTEQ